MIQWVKHFFVPAEHNEYKPHSVRLSVVIVVVLCALILEVALYTRIFIHHDINSLAAVLPAVLVSETNAERADISLGSLSINPVLTLAAQMKANDMALKGYFSHTTPEGYAPWYWLQRAGYSYTYAGENLAVNFVDSTDVTKAWMNSPLHKANIVNGKYTEIGIAVAPGMYKGRETIFVVQFFGTPQGSSIPKPIIAADLPKPEVLPATSQMPAVQRVPVVINKPVTVPKTAPAPAPVAVSKPVVVTKEITPAPVVSNKSAQAPAPVPEKVVQLTPEEVTQTEKLSTAPRTFAKLVFGVLILFLLSSLALAVFIRVRVQHPKTIAGVAAAIIFIAGLAYMNEYIIGGMVEVPQDITASTIFSL